MTRKTCLDDGDEDLYLERLQALDALENRILAQEEPEFDSENEELEDLETYASKENEKNADDNQPKLKHVNCVINNREHIDLDGLKVPALIWSRLYKFQKTGLKWMWELHSQRCGGILGDEMGLGKTIQTISYLAALSYSKLRSTGFSYQGLGPVLIVTPVTIIAQWVKEFHEWWPYFRVNVLHDIGTSQEVKTKLIEKTFNSNGILITTYSSLIIYDRVNIVYQ